VAALGRGETPLREVELLDDDTCARERLLLGLRLDEPLLVDDVTHVLERDAAESLAGHGLVELVATDGQSTLTLTHRGRFLGGGVAAELMRPWPNG
jgi:coproporphyrinogen III oxidase-like Fe-S oxidoreductase